eukprot:CAMPEP_0119004994 /NCGR_PEP_ID=MMETSP1176-20130426/1468_1 /TAXON_ID=265551 /ORGANISM="Synedropsis recta cf, Strain CCMP1620" /LENGTH=306 /DNA_ID=CAMNT_0006956757 /DNA_START=35 /DNA_END=955 /DNA_ORIENTATION=+
MSSLDSTTDLFQRLSLCETLERCGSLYITGCLVFTQILGLFVAIDVIVRALLLLILVPAFQMFQDPDYLVVHMPTFYAMGVHSLTRIMLGAVGNGAMIRAVADLYLGRKPRLRTCLRVGVKHACTNLTVFFLGFLGVMVGMLLLVVPGIYLSTAWFLVNPAIVMEGVGVFASFKRSYNLVSGSWCYVYCTFMIAYILMMILQSIQGLLVALVGGNDVGRTTISSFFGSMAAALPGIIFAPIYAIMTSIVYINLRVEKEGLNAYLLARTLGFEQGGSTEQQGDAADGTSNYSPLLSINDDDQLEEHV